MTTIEKRINAIGKLYCEFGDFVDIQKFKTTLNSKSLMRDEPLLKETLDQLEKHIMNKINGQKSGLIFEMPKKKKIQKKRQVRFSGDSKYREEMGQFQAKEGR